MKSVRGSQGNSYNVLDMSHILVRSESLAAAETDGILAPRVPPLSQHHSRVLPLIFPSYSMSLSLTDCSFWSILSAMMYLTFVTHFTPDHQFQILLSQLFVWLSQASAQSCCSRSEFLSTPPARILLSLKLSSCLNSLQSRTQLLKRQSLSLA